MTQNEIALTVAQRTGIGVCEAADVVGARFRAITAQLVDSNKVTVGWFGTFSLTHRAARSNPSTGETIQVGPSDAAQFSAATALTKQLS